MPLWLLFERDQPSYLLISSSTKQLMQWCHTFSNSRCSLVTHVMLEETDFPNRHMAYGGLLFTSGCVNAAVMPPFRLSSNADLGAARNTFFLQTMIVPEVGCKVTSAESRHQACRRISHLLSLATRSTVALRSSGLAAVPVAGQLSFARPAGQLASSGQPSQVDNRRQWPCR